MNTFTLSRSTFTLCCATQAPELTPVTGGSVSVDVNIEASIKADVFAFGVLLLELLQGQLLVATEPDDGSVGGGGDTQRALVKYSRRVQQVNTHLIAWNIQDCIGS